MSQKRKTLLGSKERELFIPKLICAICHCIPFLIFVALGAIISLLAIVGKYESIVRFSPFIILSVLVAIILLWKGKELQAIDVVSIDALFHGSKIKPSVYYKLYLILLFLAVSWILYSQALNIQSLLLIGSLYAISIFQIVSKTDINPKYVILQLFLTSILLTGSQIFTHPYYYGVDDIFPHSRWASGILESGATLTSEFAGRYTQYPLFHIGIAVTTMLSGIDISMSPYVVMVIPVLTSTILVYYISLYFVRSKRVSVAAAFFYLMIPVVLKYATSSMAFVMATFCFVIILYILTRSSTLNRIEWILLGVVITAYMTLVHHMSVVTVLLGLGIIVLSYLIYRKHATISQCIIISVVCLVSLCYASTHILSSIISIIESRIKSASPGLVIQPQTPGTTTDTSVSLNIGSNPGQDIIDTVTQLVLNPDVHVLPSVISFAVTGILVFFLLIGVYHLGSKKYIQTNQAIILPFLLLLLPIFVTGMIEILGINIEAFRFRLMMAPIYAIALGTGCVILYTLFQSKKWCAYVGKIFICLLCISLVAFSPLYATAVDAEAYVDSENEFVNYYDEHDLSLLRAIETHITYGDSIMSDHVLYRYFERQLYEEYTFPYYEMKNTIYLLYTGKYNDEGDTVNHIVFRHDLAERSELEIYVPEKENIVVAYTDAVNKNIIWNLYPYSKYYENGFDAIY